MLSVKKMYEYCSLKITMPILTHLLENTEFVIQQMIVVPLKIAR